MDATRLSPAPQRLRPPAAPGAPAPADAGSVPQWQLTLGSGFVAAESVPRLRRLRHLRTQAPEEQGILLACPAVFALFARWSWVLALISSRAPIPTPWQCRKCQKLNTCGHKIARKLCSECKILRDAGPEALSLKIHEVLGVLEEEEALDSDHPAHARINEKVEGLRIMALAYVSAPLQTTAVQQEKQKQRHLMLQKKRKQDEMMSGYGMGMYAGLPPDMASQEQYQLMAASYHQQVQLMQQQMSRKPSKMSKKAALEMNRNSADRYSPLISLLVACRVHCSLGTRALLPHARTSTLCGRDADLSGIMLIRMPSDCDGCTRVFEPPMNRIIVCAQSCGLPICAAWRL